MRKPDRRLPLTKKVDGDLVAIHEDTFLIQEQHTIQDVLAFCVNEVGFEEFAQDVLAIIEENIYD